MVVYAFDERFMPISKLQFQNWNQIKAKHNREGTIYAAAEIKTSDSLTTAVLKIKLAVREKKHGFGSIWMLRLCGHGFCGYLQFGAGLYWYNTEAIKTAFHELAPYMTRGGGGVEIWGCGVGSETDIREIGSRTQSGNSEYRPGSIPKAFVRQSIWHRYYQRNPRGQFGKLGGLATHGKPPDVRSTSVRSTLDLLYALSFALRVPVTAPIHAQSKNITQLEGPKVTVRSTPNETFLKLNIQPIGRATVGGEMSRH
jgi:hypothetical protein